MVRESLSGDGSLYSIFAETIEVNTADSPDPSLTTPIRERYMSHFTTGGKRYREGTDFPGFGGADVGVPSTGTTTYEQTAPATLPDGTDTREFLFWDTGRRITTKRTVRWTFNHAANWVTWQAWAWYGTPGDGPPSTVYTFDTFWVGTGTIDPTPIDGPGSTFVNGPSAGETAWPAGGNDHDVDTQWGDATVRAKDHLQRSSGDPELDFSSLMQLTYGGDPSGVCEENDDGVTSTSGITGIGSTTAQQITLPQGTGGLVLAGYVTPSTVVVPPFISNLIGLIESTGIVPLQPNVDPSPDDIVRLRLIADAVNLVSGERPSESDAFDGLVAAARKMSAAELKRTIAGTQATLRRGESALKSLRALAAKQAKSKG